MTPEEKAALWASLDTWKDGLNKLGEPSIRLTSAQVAEIIAIVARMRAAGMLPVVVRLTGDAAKDAAVLEEANAKRAEVEIATGRAPGLIVLDP